MKIDRLSLPHPVLGLGDDVEGKYEPIPSIRLGKEKTAISIEHVLENPTLQEMVVKGDIAFCAELNCPQTLYRNVFISRKPNQSIEIETGFLRDKVTIKFYIIAQKDISKYKPKGANQDYGEYTFRVLKGDVLAYGSMTSFIAAKSWEKLAAISSFLVITEGDSQEGPFKIDLNEDRITVQLSKKDYAVYKSASKPPLFGPIFHASVVIPALIFALQQMMTDEAKEQHEGKRWFDVLEFRKNNDEKIEKLWNDQTNVPEIAQLLLDQPFSRTLTRLEHIIDQSLRD